MLKRVLLISLQVLLIGLSKGQAQGVVTNVGGVGSGSAGSFTMHMGYTSFSGNNGNLRIIGAGASHPIEFGIVTSLHEFASNIKVKAYPNPASHSINLSTEQLKPEMTYELCFVDGRVLQNGSIRETLTQIDLSPYQGPFFLLNISYQGTTIKRLKIIKH